MKIAIHHRKGSFSDRWIDYCKEKSIDFKIVDCYATNIISELKDCDALMWHFHQEIYKDFLIAKSILTSVSLSGKKVFPDFNSYWHFDDKIAQKYLLESLNLPLARSWVFYDKETALAWADSCKFPIVFKQKRGAGSNNVRLINNKNEIRRIIYQAFGKGFPVFDSKRYFLERYRRSKEGLDPTNGFFKGLGRLFIQPEISKQFPNEKEYVYFQEYLPDNDSDIRVIVIGRYAFAIKRINRKNDFRASGSGNIRYDKEEFDEKCVSIAFMASKRIGSSCMTYDFVFNKSGQPEIIEISFGFKMSVYDPCTGYWDDKLNWYNVNFNPQGWMVDLVVNKIIT